MFIRKRQVIGLKKVADWKKQLLIEAWARQVEQTCAVTRRVLQQTKARVIQGDTHYPDKLLSIFEMEAEAIRIMMFPHSTR